MLKNNGFLVRYRTVLVLVAAILASQSTAVAATGGMQFAQAADQYSEQELRAYAAAVAAVREVTAPQGGDLQGVEQDVVAAIENAGLTVEQYNTMTEATLNDLQLANQVESYVGELE